MPLVRIDLAASFGQPARQAIADSVHQAMVETVNIPADDRFQVLTAHPSSELIADLHYLGIQRSAALVFVQITLNQGRSVAQKRALYARIAELLATSANVDPANILINLIEVPKENWSFGLGQAQYATE